METTGSGDPPACICEERGLMASDFLGRGLKFPFRFQRRSGGAQVSSTTSTEHEHIHESIIQILGDPARRTLHAPGIRLETQGPGVRAERRGAEGPDPPLRDRRRETLGEAASSSPMSLSTIPIEQGQQSSPGPHRLPCHPEPGGRQPGLSLLPRAASIRSGPDSSAPLPVSNKRVLVQLVRWDHL
ncbi:MAG: hypothetical protein MZV70_52205 [Desulfobacterales bacterium]|nr:hypothetical protein [Desulfobacterales bacterium]